MKIANARTALAAAAIAAAGILASAPVALGDASAVTTATLGSQAKLDNGNVIQGWTVTDLKPSTDAIPYDVRGTLWEVTATDEAIQGSVTPIVSNFNLRGAGGENYRALFQVATPQGVNPATIPQGQKTSGKIYFDVTGAQPTSVVYNAGGRDLLAWDKPAAPAPAPAQSGSRPATSAATPATAAPAAAAEAEGTGHRRSRRGRRSRRHRSHPGPCRSRGHPRSGRHRGRGGFGAF
ncbi:MPT63 family protein, partial [Mycolicibacterium wolinskyi]|uniref:MPT63 family protein n=1 Tax=Mycolicibacterium wolinskyi TaxID=59750 RepID=UPI0039089A82